MWSDYLSQRLEHSQPLQLAVSVQLLRKLGLSFFLFGLINNGTSSYRGCLFYANVAIFCPVLYVIILSAALDLVPPSTPKGIIAFCNIAPALAAKIGWPYILKGRIRYLKRITGCCLVSVLGMLVSGRSYFPGLSYVPSEIPPLVTRSWRFSTV